MMVDKYLSIKRVVDAIVPISRFNRGEANKIFEEVGKTGVKIVLKNNTPVGVIVEPKKYQEMVEMLEDYALYIEAEKRLNSVSAGNTLSETQVRDSLGISESELDDTDVEID